ncbi:ABC transporter permease [Brevibacillus massiliensis]|uniref:ABC transporter permease n=1 Tax=Brevibacillus massiliensis TaxID=1118054 RepID=UPI0003151494|nr:ABC transporter permease [Brevibacillus massiliensis]
MRSFSKEAVLGMIFAVLFALMALCAPGFLDAYNLGNMMFQLPELGILALAMMVVIISAGIDLSLTFTAALSGVVIALLLSKGSPILVAVLAGVAAAALCGLLNGFFVAVIGVSPILVTLGSMVLFEGLILGITKGNAISGFPDAFAVIGNGSIASVPVPILNFFAIALCTSILLNKTKWGRCVFMVGSNPLATLFSGINTRRVLLRVYLFSALLASVASIIMISRYNSAKVDLGSSYLLQSVAAAVLGGTEIAGGYGKVMGTVFAVGVFQVLSNGLNLLGVPRTVVDMMMGLILILVLVLNFLSAKARQKRVAERGVI